MTNEDLINAIEAYGDQQRTAGKHQATGDDARAREHIRLAELQLDRIEQHINHH